MRNLLANHNHFKKKQEIKNRNAHSNFFQPIVYRFNKIISPTLLLLVVAENNRRAWFYWKGRNCMVFGKENLFLPRIGSKPSGTIFTFEPDTQPLHVTFYNKQGRRINSKFGWAHFINKFTIKKLVGQVIIQDHLKV